ncbi:hypothetical protein K502DRAFT_170014 [Neoconidiobolus thromboides FSU 785]|nr:hypothetical protein K502DRAFT_170014 [Neoconidiobolus thromboides FSU 785]
MGIKYTSAYFQVILVGFICFCCPGMFNVLNSIGGGGLVDDNTSKYANVAIYTTFTVFGILGGGIVNILGTKWSLAISGIGYAFYSASYLIYNATGAGGVVIFAGALLGACAGVLWAAQGQIMMAYATESNKGKYIATFWIIFNLGAVLGSIIPFALNYHQKAGALGQGTYIGLIIVMLVGCAISLALAPIGKVVREDGTPVKITPYENVLSEAIGALKVFTDFKMLALLPLFLASNWFYTYQFDLYNGILFNVRTRSFNNIWYWSMQMVGAFGIGKILDNSKMSRSKRGLYGLAALTIAFTAVWAGGLAFQNTFTKEDNKYFVIHEENPDAGKGIDFTHGKDYAGPLVLYMLYGLLDAMLQSLSYWVMGSLSNDAQTLTRYAGFYKGIQSFGAAIAWGISTSSASYLAQLIICWALLEISVPGAFFVIKNISDYGDDNQPGVTKNEIDLEAKS